MAKIPVFVVHGFLESGKTQFAMETLSDEYFSDGERNLVIACEEGIEEYEDEVLQKSNTTLVMLEDKSEFNEMFLAECQKKYKPTQVIVEYNCMWGLDYLREMYMPKGWFVAQVITTVDATTFDVYLKNMKSIFMEMAKDSDLIIFNRSTEDTPAATYKRNMRAVNPKARWYLRKKTEASWSSRKSFPLISMQMSSRSLTWTTVSGTSMPWTIRRSMQERPSNTKEWSIRMQGCRKGILCQDEWQ